MHFFNIVNNIFDKNMTPRTPLQNDRNLKYFKEKGNLRQKEKMGKKSDFIYYICRIKKSTTLRKRMIHFPIFRALNFVI